MKLVQETSKTFAELSTEELKHVLWENVSMDELKTISGRELSYAPHTTLFKYFNNFKAAFDIMTVPQWLRHVHSCKNENMGATLIRIMRDAGATQEFFEIEMNALVQQAISQATLVEQFVLPVSHTTELINHRVLNHHNTPTEERIKYLKNSNYLYELYWDHFDQPLILTSEEMVDVGLPDTYKHWEIEDYAPADLLRVVYSEKYAHIVGEKSLTWNTAIEIMRFDKERWGELYYVLHDVWNNVSVLEDVTDPNTLLNPDLPKLEDQ